MDSIEIKKKIELERKLKDYEGEDKVVDVKEVYEEEKKNQTPVIFGTGIHTIDNLIEGFKFGQLICITGIAKRGKCYARGTKVLLSNGKSLSVEKVNVGDNLMGNDSTPRKVLSLGRGRELMYKIIPSKGESFMVNESHILSLKKVTNGISNKGKRLIRKNGNKITNISIKNYLSLSEEEQSFYSLYRVPLKFKKKKLPINPYFIGLWLGDGNSRDVRISCNDKETTSWLIKYADELGGNIVFVKQPVGKCPLIGITFGKGNGGNSNKFSLQSELRKLNLLNNKHIPHKYKANNKKNRLELLAGLIDSDGCKSNQRYEFCNKNKTLINDFIFLCRSLGFSAYKVSKIVNGQLYYVVNLTGNLCDVPVKIKRKKIRKRKVIRDGLLIPFTIEIEKERDYYGFELDGNHLHVLENFFVSHNTTFAKTITKNIEKKMKILWFSFEESVFEFYKDIDPADFFVPKKMKYKDMEWVEERIIESKLKYKTEVVFIDHLHYLFALTTASNTPLLIGDLMRNLKRIAIEQGVTIFILAHTKKIDGNRMPRAEDVRDSALIANECDKMFVVHRDRTETEGLAVSTLSSETKICIELDRQNGKNMGIVVPLDFENNVLVAQKNEFERTEQNTEKSPMEEAGGFFQ